MAISNIKGEKISIVIPVYNEESSLEELNSRLHKTLGDITQDYEIIYVNDASVDNSLSIMLEFYKKDKRVKIVNLSRNFGHQSALTAGIECASGDCVILIDADLQDCPEAILDFYTKWREGYDVVYAIRTKRKEAIFKRIAFRGFYRLLSLVANMLQPLDAGIFSLMDKRVVDVLKSLKEKNKYITGLRSYIGFKQIGIQVERDIRKTGRPKVRTVDLFRLAFNAIFSFSYLPLRLATLGGIFIASLAFLATCYFITVRVLSYFQLIKARIVPGLTLIVSSLFLLTGAILICMGIIGEYIGRIYDEVKDRPYFIIKDKIGFNN